MEKRLRGLALLACHTALMGSYIKPFKAVALIHGWFGRLDFVENVSASAFTLPARE
jgi:hypothetical protein